MATTVNTVTGPISSDELGKTLMHEHFFFGYPGYAGDTTFGSNSREDVINTGIDVARGRRRTGSRR